MGNRDREPGQRFDQDRPNRDRDDKDRHDQSKR
jgi:hypothetical protein